MLAVRQLLVLENTYKAGISCMARVLALLAQDIREKIAQAEKEKDNFEEAEESYENWIEKFVRHGTLAEVTREIVTELIDKIIVNGDKSIDIVFKYQSPYEKHG